LAGTAFANKSNTQGGGWARQRMLWIGETDRA
jgi:hypothetical protein